MCGLVGVFSKRNRDAGQYAFELYTKQKTRGQRGFGYVAIKDGYVMSVERGTSEAEIKPKLLREKADIILFHHRLPTSTENLLGTTHPIFVDNEELKYKYLVAHNGIITNTTALKAKHNELGYVYNTEHSVDEKAIYNDGSIETLSNGVVKFNDSECLAIETARYIEEKSEVIGVTGSVAMWVVQIDKDTDKVIAVFYGKNYGRDLCRVDNHKWVIVSSETGTPVEDLRMFKLDIANLTTTDTKLSILDESRPVQTVTHYRYGEHSYGYRTPLPTPTVTEPPVKKLSYGEVKSLGHEIKDYDIVWEGCATYYVPKEKVVLIGDLTPKSHDHDKAMQRLEELALEYVAAQVEAEKADDMLQDGAIEYHEYTRVFNKAQDDMEVAESLMSSLGLSYEEVERAMSRAEELKVSR